MTDSIDVLSTLKLVYTIYAVVAISLIGWYAYRITRDGEAKSSVKPVYFWSYTGVLIVVGTGLHFLTFNLLPWVPMDLDRANIKAEKTFKITYEKHEIKLDENPMRVPCDKYVIFDAYSKDLTYGFGIIRKNHTLVTQMQVVPDNGNDLMWIFHKNGTYDIRSTEYSGPKGAHMVVEDAVIVTGCEEDDIHSMKVEDK